LPQQKNFDKALVKEKEAYEEVKSGNEYYRLLVVKSTHIAKAI